MRLSAEDLKRAMAQKTDQELYDVVFGHASEYTAEAIEIAKGELAGRGLDERARDSLAILVNENKQIEEAPLGWFLRLVSFFGSTMFLGIPAFLAHRHYVEEGARRKAREWARWAWYGFFFYLGLVLLRLI